MKILAKKNVMKCVSRPSLYTIPRRHEIFQSASAAENKDGLLLRRFRWSLNESKIFSNAPPESFTSATKLSALIASGFKCESPDAEEFPYFCSTATRFFTALSPDTLSPIKPPHCFPHLNDYLIFGGCGGVVCLYNNKQGAVFWNPSTNTVKSLPPSDVHRPNPAEAYPLTIDAFDFSCGFGFDSKTQDYKFIRWITFFFVDEHYRVHDQDTICELYSLSNDSWKPVYKSEIYCYAAPGLSACIGGDSYWSMGRIEDAKILRFDFTTEKFSYIPFPALPEGKLKDVHRHLMYDFGGRVGVVVFEKDGVDKTFEVLSWDAQRSWWQREMNDHIAGAACPLGFSRDGRFMFLVGTDRRLLAYDVRARQVVKKFDVYCSPYDMDLVHYQDTAFPLNA